MLQNRSLIKKKKSQLSHGEVTKATFHELLMRKRPPLHPYFLTDSYAELNFTWNLLFTGKRRYFKFYTHKSRGKHPTPLNELRANVCQEECNRYPTGMKKAICRR